MGRDTQSWRGTMPRNDERELREQLARLRIEHRDLDEDIIALERDNPSEQLAITRLKRKKLRLKDQIARLEDQLFPDIIA